MVTNSPLLLNKLFAAPVVLGAGGVVFPGLGGAWVEVGVAVVVVVWVEVVVVFDLGGLVSAGWGACVFFDGELPLVSFSRSFQFPRDSSEGGSYRGWHVFHVHAWHLSSCAIVMSFAVVCRDAHGTEAEK